MDKSDVNTLWNTDGVVKAPSSALRENPDNKHWTPASLLRSIRDALRPEAVRSWLEIWPNEGPSVSAGVAARRAAIFSYHADRKIDALLAAVGALAGGQDVPAAVRAELDRAAEREREEREAELAPILERLVQAEVERAELAELIRQAQSGELDAAAVVDEIGRRLTAAVEAG